MGAAVGFKIPEFKPKYELFLSGYAQIQNIIINKDYLIAMDNDNTVSIFKCTIEKPFLPARDDYELNDKNSGSPINLPSVGPINASSGVRHQNFSNSAATKDRDD